MAILMKGVEKGAHWYTRDGVPMHRVMKADGSGDRATTLKDARRLGLLPSVTGAICGCSGACCKCCKARRKRGNDLDRRDS